jgi:Tfp pilus assembly protein PilF
MRKAAAREDATEKHVVTPGPIIPARELLADLLLASGKTSDALAEYEAVLNKEPNRYRAVLGAARAASRAGNESRARELFKHLTDMAKEADSARDGLEEARQSVSRG